MPFERLTLATRRRFLTTALGAAAVVRAQESAPVLKTGIKLVNVFATVRNRKHEVIKNLSQEDFAIDEDGGPQIIRYFARENDLELTLGVLIDTSGSQRSVLGEERSASYRFLDQVLREDKDFAFVIGFDREVELVVDLTASRKTLEKGIFNLQAATAGRRGPEGDPDPSRRRGGGGTALYDAVMLASEDVTARQQGRKALIILSDGEDRGSKVSLHTAINAAQKSDTLVYGVLFEAPSDFYPGPMYHRGRRAPMPQQRLPGPDGDGKKVLERLARETGGSFYTVTRKTPLSWIFDRMQEELRSQYSLGYTPDRPAKPGEFRKIRVTTRDKTLVVQSRDGYYGAN